MKIKPKHNKNDQKTENPEKSLRNLVKDEDKENKSFEDAMEQIWNPEI